MVSTLLLQINFLVINGFKINYYKYISRDKRQILTQNGMSYANKEQKKG